MSDPILVTGAAGKTGRAVIRALVRSGLEVRAFVRRKEQQAAVEQAGAGDVVLGDLLDAATVAKASRGARAIYHICPNVHPEEVSIGQVVIEAARTAGVWRLAYHSVLHPQTEAMPHHWRKMRVEERLVSSGLAFTLLQPAIYMQNLRLQWDESMDHGRYQVPYSKHAHLALVDLEDLAAVAATVLTGEEHAYASYPLCGEILTPEEIAEIVSRELGRKVQAEEITRVRWAEEARRAGLGDQAVETLLAMFRYYHQYGLPGSSSVLRWLLGREPTSFASFVRRRGV